MALSDEGVCTLGYGKGLDCVIEVPASYPVIYLRSPLMQLPPNDREALFKKLLTLNFLGIETGGASFAIDEEESTVVLWLSRRISDLDQTGFETLLGNFLAVAEQWKLKLSPARLEDVPHRTDEQTNDFDPLTNLQFRA